MSSHYEMKFVANIKPAVSERESSHCSLAVTMFD